MNVIRSSVCCLLAAAVVSGGLSAKDSKTTGWSLKEALKQIDKATKGLRGISADVHYTETGGAQDINGKGTIWVSYDGQVRADIESSNEQRTFIALSPYLYIHRPNWKTVEIYDLRKRHQRLVQYALAGFVPSGTSMKKVYNVQLVEQSKLDDTQVLLFRLTPKSKEIASVLSEILLWVDVDSWLPARQQIAHKTANVQLNIRYFNPAPDNAMPEDLFRPKWPVGTEQVLK